MFSVRRATERDLDQLTQLCTEAGQRGLLTVRRQAFSPSAWLAARVPLVMVADATKALGFAVALPDAAPLGAPKCAEAIVHVTPSSRRQGAGRAALVELVAVARLMGLWKLVAYAFPDDVGARALFSRADFREVGVLVKHVQIEGSWRDVAIHERLVLAARKSTPSMSDA
jgi:phosphinothricin acetyltransferase